MIVSHLLLILHKQIQFYIFMFEAWNVAKGRKVQGGRILSQGTVTTEQSGLPETESPGREQISQFWTFVPFGLHNCHNCRYHSACPKRHDEEEWGRGVVLGWRERKRDIQTEREREKERVMLTHRARSERCWHRWRPIDQSAQRGLSDLWDTLTPSSAPGHLIGQITAQCKEWHIFICIHIGVI